MQRLRGAAACPAARQRALGARYAAAAVADAVADAVIGAPVLAGGGSSSAVGASHHSGGAGARAAVDTGSVVTTATLLGATLQSPQRRRNVHGALLASPDARSYRGFSRFRGLAEIPTRRLLPTASRGAATAAAASESQEDRSKAVVLSKRLPQDFIENTLLPHLESQLLENIHVYTPAELAKIARAYSQQEVRQYALCVKLAETVQDRISGFEAVDIVDILGPLWSMVPGHDEVFEALEQKIIIKIDDFTALNLIGIIRIYNKRSSKHHDLMSKVLPRLRELLKDYEAVELTEMLMSIAQSAEAEQDMDILMTLVPEIERRYSEVSLVHAINNVWALVQLKVVHPSLLAKVAEDLRNPTKTKDLTPAYMSRIVWVYRRCNAWDQISDSILPLIRSSAAEFRCGEFARLAQALPEEDGLLRRIADLLRLGLIEMGRKDFMLFFLGCVHGQVLETARDPPATEDPEALVAHCLRYIREEQDNFKRDEIQKIVYLLRYAKPYRHLLDDLPASWNSTKEETLDYINAKS